MASLSQLAPATRELRLTYKIHNNYVGEDEEALWCDDSRDNRREGLLEVLYARVHVGQPCYHRQDDYGKKSCLHADLEVHDYGHGNCAAADFVIYSCAQV